MSEAYFTTIHTDGGAAPNPGEAAYVAVLQNGNKTACVRGYAPMATNQQMELAAAIAGLSCLKSSKIPIKIITDSQYVHDGASKWIINWRRNGWQDSQGRPLKNLELWQTLDQMMHPYVISWVKVKGHSGIEGNVTADNLVWDTRDAKGDPIKYQVTTIPTIAGNWNYNQFIHSLDSGPVQPVVAEMRQRLAHLLQG